RDARRGVRAGGGCGVELVQGLRTSDRRVYAVRRGLERNPAVTGEEDLDPAVSFDGVHEVLPALIIQAAHTEAAHLPAGNAEHPKHDVHGRWEALEGPP